MTDWGQDRSRTDPLEGNAVTKWADLLMGILEDLARLESGLVAIKLEQARLEKAGMYPAVPSESWESRPSAGRVEAEEKKYLRMVFPMGALEGGGRKLYVGCDPARIRASQDKATRRLRWERLEVERGRLERALGSLRLNLEREAQRANMQPIPEELGLELPALVTTGGQQPADPVTKEPALGTAGDVGELDSVTKERGEWLRTRPEVEYNVREGEDG